MKEILDLVTLMEKRISTLEIETDSLRIRIRKRMFPKEETEELKPGIDDGFDELRKLNKAKRS